MERSCVRLAQRPAGQGGRLLRVRTPFDGPTPPVPRARAFADVLRDIGPVNDDNSAYLLRLMRAVDDAKEGLVYQRRLCASYNARLTRGTRTLAKQLEGVSNETDNNTLRTFAQRQCVDAGPTFYMKR